MNRKLKTFLGIMSVALILTGCGPQLPELTENESEKIAEYAATVLLQYEKTQKNRLVDTNAMEEQMELKKQQEEAEQKEVEKQEASEEVQEENQESSEPVAITYQDIASFMGFQDVSIDYAGYEICDKYPSDSMSFSMQATPNHKLLVLKFSVSNNGTEEKSVDIFSLHNKYRLAIDGESNIMPLTTMLMNDLMTFQEVVGAGEVKEAVLVTEVLAEEEPAIASINLTIRNSTGDMTTTLQ